MEVRRGCVACPRSQKQKVAKLGVKSQLCLHRSCSWPLRSATPPRVGRPPAPHQCLPQARAPVIQGSDFCCFTQLSGHLASCWAQHACSYVSFCSISSTLQDRVLLSFFFLLASRNLKISIESVGCIWLVPLWLVVREKLSHWIIKQPSTSLSPS